MSSSIVLLDSGGIHYIKTPLRNMMAEMEVKATISLLSVHRLIKGENTTTLADSK